MKVLLDTCVAGALVGPALAEAGHDVVWAGDWHSDPGDKAILAHAHREGRVLVLDEHRTELTSAAFITVERTRLRIRLKE